MFEAEEEFVRETEADDDEEEADIDESAPFFNWRGFKMWELEGGEVPAAGKKLISVNSSAKSEAEAVLLEVRDGGGGGVIFLLFCIKIQDIKVYNNN